jgi:serine protease DegQ
MRKLAIAVAMGWLCLAAPAMAAAPPSSLAPILAAVSPGVVNIAVEGTVASQPNPLFNDPFFRQFFGNLPDQPSRQKFQAVGSGVIIDAGKGMVITNNHVVEHADRIKVTLADRREVNAKLVGTDPQTDIAVLKIPAEHLTAVPIGESSKLQVGDYVVALGDPFGLGRTATFGIVSALGRSGLGIEGYEDFIQTDAAINPGNSGGALIDMNGKLIGINTAIVNGGGGGSVGIGFAIPADMAKNVADQLAAHGKIERGQLGVLVQDVTPEIGQAMGGQENSGALVSQVQKDSPASKAGVKAGDVIVALDGKPVNSSSDLRNAVGLSAPGRTITLSLWRKGRQLTLTATIEKPSPQQQVMNAPEQSVLEGVKLSAPPNGDKGAYVAAVAPGSRAAAEGLQERDLIIAADQQPVEGVRDVMKVVKEHEQQPLVVVVERGGDQLVLVLS